MRILLLILLSYTCSAQVYVRDSIEDISKMYFCDTAMIDTIRVDIVAFDSTTRFNYYYKNGTLAASNKKYADSSLIPAGGYMTEYYLHKGALFCIKGYAVRQMRIDCVVETIKVAGLDWKPVPKAYKTILLLE